MRISSLYIDNFGLFHNESLENIEPGLALFQGNNEAGKSTLLGFIRTILFGFPRTNSPDHYPTLNNGALGGRIALVNSNGQEFLMERTPGPKGGKVHLQGPEGMTVQPESLNQLLNGLTYDVFKNIFAFSLTELQTVETLDSENVKSVIYGASAGTGALALSNAYRRIENQLDGLFKPGGRIPALNKKIKELETIQGDLREARKGLDKYNQACGELEETERKIRELSAEFALLNRAQRKYENFEKLWPDWLILLEKEQNLKNLEEVVEIFPENGLEDYRAEKEVLDAGQKQLAGLKAEAEQLEREANGLQVDTSLLEMGQEISFLFESKNEYTENRKQIPLLEQELGTEQKEIARLIVSLGPDWSEESALRIDRSLFTRDAIRRNEDTLNKARSELSTAARILADKKTEHENLVQEEARASQDAEQLRPGEPGVDKQIIRNLRHDRNVFANAIRDIPKRETELEQAEKELTRLVKEIDPAWTEADLDNFDLSMIARKKVEDFSAGFSRAANDIRTAQTIHQALITNLEKIEEKQNLAAARLKSWPQLQVSSPGEIKSRREDISNLKNKLLERNQIESDIHHQGERLSDKKAELKRLTRVANKRPLLSPLWLLILAILAAVLIFTQMPEKSLMFRFTGLGLVILTLALLHLVVRFLTGKFKDRFRPKERPGHPLEAQIKNIQEILSTKQIEYSVLRANITAQSGSLGLDAAVSLPELDHIERQAENDIRAFEEWTRLAEEVQKYKQESDQLKADLTGTENSLKKHEQRLTDLNQEWAGLLEKMRLSPDMTTAMVIEVFSKVQAGRQQLSHIHTLKNRIREMQETRDKYLQLAAKIPELEKYAETAGGEEILPEIDRFFVKLDNLAEKREQYRLAEKSLEEKRNQTRGAEKALREAEGAHSEAKEINAEAVKGWQTWLDENGIPKGLSPATALEALDRIDKLVQRISKKEELEHNIGRRKIKLKQYEELLEKIMDTLGRPAPDADKYALVAEEQHSRLNVYRGNLQERNRILKGLEEVKARSKTVQEEIEQRKSRIDELLKSVGVESDEEFLKQGRQFFARKELLEKIAAAEHNMRKFSGEPDLAGLKQELSGLTIDEIQIKDKQLEQEARDIEDSLESFRDKKAELNKTIETLMSAEDLAQLRAAEESALTEIQQDAHTWSVYSLAEYFMNRAREKFEKEQQPKVIREGSGFFNKITQGRYESLLAPMGGDAIEAITPDRKRKKLTELSRGTAEQLYLALRFGYIRNYASSSDPMPVIMDDILVNFDPYRAKGAAEAIMELAGRHQILFFTCHPATVDIFKALDSKIPVYHLEDGHLSGQETP
ncbi:MAG: AAA family ATPase [Deltaproteobacteria bacterium]|nr:AAA family ATPase [Deltaproteobacteria bacterium]